MTDNLSEISKKASSDPYSYCAYEIGEALSIDAMAQVQKCAEAHSGIFEELDQFCVVMLIAHDPVIKNMKRRKFYAWPFLPKPRPNQTVWLVDRSGGCRMLWCLPCSDTMAILSILISIDPAYRRMKRWCDSFYTLNFWHDIRKEHEICMLSEEEHLDIVRKKGAHLGREDLSPFPTNPIDALRFNTEQVVNA